MKHFEWNTQRNRTHAHRIEINLGCNKIDVNIFLHCPVNIRFDDYQMQSKPDGKGKDEPRHYSDPDEMLWPQACSQAIHQGTLFSRLEIDLERAWKARPCAQPGDPRPKTESGPYAGIGFFSQFFRMLSNFEINEHLQVSEQGDR